MKLTSKALYLLLSVAFAVGMWFYVVTVVSPDSDKSFYNIKVDIEGERLLNDQGLVITNIKNLPTVTLQLNGNRIDLNKLSSDIINISVDVSKISEAGKHDLPYTITFPGDVASNAFTVLNKAPGSVQVVVDDRLSKNVPVKINYVGEVSENYLADKDKAEYTRFVNVSGPKTVVELIYNAQIEVNLEGRKENLADSFTYTLCGADGKPVNAEGVTTDVGKVDLSLRIAQVKTVKLDVTLKNGSGATKADCEYKLSTESIQVFGNPDKLSKVPDVLFLGEIDLGEIRENMTDAEKDEKLKFKVTLPEGVTNLTTGADWVNVTVTFPELAEKTMSVKSFKLIGVQDGLVGKVNNKEIENVTFRGPKEVIAALTEENVVAEVDFTGADLDTKSLYVTFLYGNTRLSTFASYEVGVTVTEYVPPEPEPQPQPQPQPQPGVTPAT